MGSSPSPDSAVSANTETTSNEYASVTNPSFSIEIPPALVVTQDSDPKPAVRSWKNPSKFTPKRPSSSRRYTRGQKILLALLCGVCIFILLLFLAFVIRFIIVHIIFQKRFEKRAERTVNRETARNLLVTLKSLATSMNPLDTKFEELMRRNG